MAHNIAQSGGENDRCTTIRREEHRTLTTADMLTVNNSSTHEQKLQEIEVLAMVSTAAAGESEVRPARKRRHRRGRNLHRHRLSKHRRDQARALKSVMGAPRNDNEYLMSQYNEGLHLQEAQISDSRDTSGHLDQAGLFFQSCLSPVGQDDIACPFLSPRLSSPDGSVSSGSSPSDYSSLPSSPDEESRYHGCRELLPASRSQPERTDAFESGCEVVMDGTDADFLRRNFEEEYANNITRVLEEATKEELISKCMVLMEKLKELEQRKFC